jgi:hypothetical protein
MLKTLEAFVPQPAVLAGLGILEALLVIHAGKSLS